MIKIIILISIIGASITAAAAAADVFVVAFTAALAAADHILTLIVLTFDMLS